MIGILSLIFLGTLSVIVGGYVFINRRSLTEADIARDRLSAPESAERTWRLLKDERVSDLGFVNAILAGKGWVEELGIALMRAGVSMKPGAFIMVWITCGVLFAFIGLMLMGGFFGVIVAVFGAMAPILWLRRKHKKRLSAFENQIPDAVDMLVSAMKAGYSFQAATQFIGSEMTAPAGPEFARFYDEQRLGIEVRTALLNMQTRMDSQDLKMFVTAVLIQRETGGNLAEVLQNLADIIRERIAMRGHIETLIAEPRMSARFLALLPVVVALILMVVSPQFLDPMLESSGGRTALGVAGLGVIFGYGIMMRIADVDI
ncbi:MAG TPA: type II secretion system F family protein [Gemmatimonadaceae bacterium]|nr:type II secretion system F family protein [Gemmatimonadaceae bacterium]